MKKRKLLVKAFFAVLIIGLFSAAAVFLSREPIILVTDTSFTNLYGVYRGRLKQLFLSISLFRMIKTVSIAEGAGPDLVAHGAASLSRRPLAVFFPYRFREGARRYLKDRPGSPVVILGGRYRGDLGGGVYDKGQILGGLAEPLWICTDTETDLYRAGFIAGKLARFEEIERRELKLRQENEAQDKDVNNGGEDNNEEDSIEDSEEYLIEDPVTKVAQQGILLFFQKRINEAEIAAFKKGMGDYWTEDQLFFFVSEEIEILCAVIMGNFNFNREENLGSLVLFTWMDPVLIPRKTMALFDDSPWVQIKPALAILKEGKAGLISLIPSEITIFGRDEKQKSKKIEIQGVKTLIYSKENTDN
ncbi:MAG: hypothetical protein LBH07_09040 [Treponema sp.]|jgi:hypothetical protein|nr:hypothetical protein [Treponema sp.]